MLLERSRLKRRYTQYRAKLLSSWTYPKGSITYEKFGSSEVRQYSRAVDSDKLHVFVYLSLYEELSRWAASNQIPGNPSEIQKFSSRVPMVYLKISESKLRSRRGR